MLKLSRYPTLDAWLREVWEGRYVTNWDANDMLALLATWQKGDIAQVRDNGDLDQCLGSIRSKALIMPCRTDLYFCVSRSSIEPMSCIRMLMLPIAFNMHHLARG